MFFLLISVDQSYETPNSCIRFFFSILAHQLMFLIPIDLFPIKTFHLTQILCRKKAFRQNIVQVVLVIHYQRENLSELTEFSFFLSPAANFCILYLVWGLFCFLMSFVESQWSLDVRVCETICPYFTVWCPKFLPCQPVLDRRRNFHLRPQPNIRS